MDVIQPTIRYLENEDDSVGSNSPHMILEEGGDQLTGGVDSSPAMLFDQGNHYEIRSQSGEHPGVTYRMVQVIQDEDGQARLVDAMSSTQMMLQSVGEARNQLHIDGDSALTFVPSNSTSLGCSQQTIDAFSAGSTNTVGQVNTSAGQFFVMMSSDDLVQQSGGQRVLIPRQSGTIKSTACLPLARDDRRKQTHKEVERRRRDKINTWIIQLAKLVPDCANESAKQGESKCTVLSKACDYITDLRTANSKMAESLRESEASVLDIDMLRQQCDQLKQENDLLWTQLRDNGIDVVHDRTSDGEQ